jgi:hypothetical protein
MVEVGKWPPQTGAMDSLLYQQPHPASRTSSPGRPLSMIERPVPLRMWSPLAHEDRSVIWQCAEVGASILHGSEARILGDASRRGESVRIGKQDVQAGSADGHNVPAG